ncbi:MAG: hypothetical protein AAF573_06570 [Bacteroidota bacterium]
MKKAFCAGQLEVTWNMLADYFPNGIHDLVSEKEKFSSKSYNGYLHDAFHLMAIELYEHPQNFCKSNLTDYDFLKTLFRTKLKEVINTHKTLGTSFDEAFMGNGGGDSRSDQHQQQTSEIDFFARSLNPIEAVIFNVKFIMGWKNKSNILHLIAFLLNTNRLTDLKLNTQLRKNKNLSYPIITEWYKELIEHSFLKKCNPPSQSWSLFFESMPTVVIPAYKNEMRIHSQNFSRKKLKFREQMLWMNQRNWLPIERFFFMLHEYLLVESLIEIWFQLSKASIQNESLRRDLVRYHIFYQYPNDNNWPYEMREEQIKRRLHLGKKEAHRIRVVLQKLQLSIDKKIGRYLDWCNLENIKAERRHFKKINWRTH